MMAPGEEAAISRSRGSARRRRTVTAICRGLLVLVLVGGLGSAEVTDASATRPGDGCDDAPTGVVTKDYWLHFKVPVGLMPDPRFDRRPAKLEVHRVRPVYAHGKCAGIQSTAAVLIHGRTVPGPAVFDLRDPTTGDGRLSLQYALAMSGVDTFAPSLLGFGRSTRFDEGLNDPANASLGPYSADGSCPDPEGCDRTPPPWSLDQQRTMLLVNPLSGTTRPHSSSVRFATTDVWVRDIRQVIDDALRRAQPTDGKVVLLGYSLGAQRVGRTLYAANPVLPGGAEAVGKVSRVVLVSPIFGGPTEETPPPAGFPTFPLAVNDVGGSDMTWAMPASRETACTGHVIPGTKEQLWKQTMALETVGREWGGDDPRHPIGLNRSPTFSGYGWNAQVAGQVTAPVLIIQGLEDIGVPGGATNATSTYNALPGSLTNKVLVHVECASHALPFEGCDGARCTPTSTVPYGEEPGSAWAGPHSTLKAAVIEWIESGTFDGATSGRFIVDAGGVARPAP